MNILVKTINQDEVASLREVFEKMDVDGTGMINASELSQYLKQKHLSMSNEEIKDLIAEIDYQGNGKINYSEFLSATIDTEKFLTEQRLRAIFHQFDTDNSERITAENIHFAFQKLGQEVSMEEIQAMIKKHDLTGDNCLSFDEFKAIFFGNQGD